MSLRDTLETSFSGDGVDAAALLEQIGELYRALDLPESPFDPASIADQLDALADTDPSDVTALLEASFNAATAAIAALPGTGDGLAALRDAVTTLEALASGSTGIVDGLRGALLDTLPGETGVDRAARAMTAVGEIGSEVGGLVTTAVPDLRVERLGPIGDVFAAAGGLAPALASLESLMQLVGGLDRVAALQEAIGSIPDAQAIAALQAEIAAWDPSTTVARIASGDAVDAIIDDVAPALGRLRDLEQAVADLVAGSTAVVDQLDPAVVLEVWRTAETALDALDPAPVRALAEELAAALKGLLDTLPDPAVPAADAFVAEVDALLTGLTDALAAVPVDRFAAGISAGAAHVTEPIHVVGDALGTVRGVVLEAEEAVGAILGAIDLTPISDGIGAVTEPVAAAIEEIRTAFAAVSDALGTGAEAATDAINELRDGADEIATTLGTAFGAVADALDSIDLAGKLEQVRTALEPVAQALDEVKIADAAEVASEGIETVAAVIDALPLELLPDSARSELDTVTAPLKSFDFDTEVRDRIAAMLAEIEAAIDTEVLDQVRAAQADAAAFIASIDPRPPLEELERETFTAALERLDSVDPDAALAPVYEAIAAIPDLSHLLDPADDLFAEVLAGYDQLAPRPLLEPVMAPLAEARAAVAEQLRLDPLRAQVDAARTAALDAVEQVNVARWLDALGEAAAAALPGGGATGGAPLGQLVMRLTGSDAGLDPRTFALAADIVSGRAASTALTEAATATRDALTTLRTTVRDLDGGAALAAMQPGYDAVAAAIADVAAGTPLRRRLNVLLPPSPATLAAPFAKAQGDAVAKVTGALTLASQLAAYDLHRIEAAVAGLRDALEPLGAVVEWLVAWIRRTGAAIDPDNLAAAAAAALDAVRARVRAAVGLRMQAQLRESLRTAVTAIADALVGVIDGIRDALGALDPEPLVAELEALHASKRTELEALRPSTQLAPVVAALATLEHDLRTFDPLADVRPVLVAFRAAADAVGTELRPSILLAPAIESFERVADTVTSADVDHLFGPVLDALHRVTEEVGDGLDDVGMAFGKLQAALP